MTIRATVAGIITGATTGLQVYDHLSDVVALPAAVIERTETRPKTTGGPNNLEHDLTIHLLARRAVPKEAETEIEGYFMDIAEACRGVGVRWVSFSGAKTYSINQTDAIGGELAVVAKE